MKKRIFLIVLDSFGCGEMPDAKDFGDEGSDTLRAVCDTGILNVPNMKKLGLFNIDGVTCGEKESFPVGSYGRLKELSKGKDTTTGHWEMAGIVTSKPFPVFHEGFPEEVLRAFSEATGRGVLCNKPYSGTEVIKDYGREHEATGKLIVYTSADSVFQIAAHEDIVPCELLYDYCRKARSILTGDYGVGRVIARPFIGKWPDYVRPSRRHDFSLEPTGTTMLDVLSGKGFDVIGVGKIKDIFAGRGLTEAVPTSGNTDGIAKTIALMDKDFEGLCFVNLVDFDMLYGHRNDAVGYAKALNEFDEALGVMTEKLRPDDLIMITADHGCDPSTPSTDHSREYVPLLIYGKDIKPTDFGTTDGFYSVAATVLDNFGCEILGGRSFIDEIGER